jgi:hypothetical protein
MTTGSIAIAASDWLCQRASASKRSRPYT